MRTPPLKKAATPVSLHIERLVLDGVAFNSTQSAQMQRSLERELARLAAASDGTSWPGGALPAALAPSLHLASPVRPAQLGRDVARSLFVALRGGR